MTISISREQRHFVRSLAIILLVATTSGCGGDGGNDSFDGDGGGSGGAGGQQQTHSPSSSRYCGATLRRDVVATKGQLSSYSEDTVERDLAAANAKLKQGMRFPVYQAMPETPDVESSPLRYNIAVDITKSTYLVVKLSEDDVQSDCSRSELYPGNPVYLLDSDLVVATNKTDGDVLCRFRAGTEVPADTINYALLFRIQFAKSVPSCPRVVPLTEYHFDNFGIPGRLLLLRNG